MGQTWEKASSSPNWLQNSSDLTNPLEENNWRYCSDNQILVNVVHPPANRSIHQLYNSVNSFIYGKVLQSDAFEGS